MHKYKCFRDDKTLSFNLLLFLCCQEYKLHVKLGVVCWEHISDSEPVAADISLDGMQMINIILFSLRVQTQKEEFHLGKHRYSLC